MHIINQVDIVRLVSDDGLIAEDAFYNYLSAWVGNDPLTYSASEAQIRPAPKAWFHNRKENNMLVPRSSAIYFAQMPFYLNSEFVHRPQLVKLKRFFFKINYCKSLTATSVFQTLKSNQPLKIRPVNINL